MTNRDQSRKFQTVALAVVLLLVNPLSLWFYYSQLSPKERSRRELEGLGISAPLYQQTAFQSAREGKLRNLNLLGKAGADLNELDFTGRTPLMLAIRSGHPDVVEYLVDTGVDVDKKDSQGFPALSHALSLRDLTYAKLILPQSKQPNVPLGLERRSAAQSAVIGNNLEVLRLLLDHGVDPFSRSKNGESLLDLALERSYYEVIDELLRCGGAPIKTAEDRMLLHKAVIAQDLKLVRILLEHGADVSWRDQNQEEPVYHALQLGNIEMLTMLLDYGADPNASDRDHESLLHHAIELKRMDMAETLVRFDANPNVMDHRRQTPLWHAILADEDAFVKLLVDNGADVNLLPEEHEALLVKVADGGNLKIIEELLTGGANPYLRDSGGLKLVQHAAETDDRALMRLLLSADAELRNAVAEAILHVKKDSNETLLEVAVRQEIVQLMEPLVKYGADPNGMTTRGQSLLALAVAVGSPQSVQALIDTGAEVDRELKAPASSGFRSYFKGGETHYYLDKERGVTPLMLACLSNQESMVRVLLRNGAKTTKKTKRAGVWPINMAAYWKNIEIMQLLLGREPNSRQPRQMVIDLSDQTARLFKDGHQVDLTRVSTGMKGYRTPTGNFVITDKHRVRVSNLYNVKMPYFMRLNCSAIGMHEGFVPDHAASHGCIRLPTAMAKKLFGTMHVGDLVSIVP